MELEGDPTAHLGSLCSPNPRSPQWLYPQMGAPQKARGAKPLGQNASLKPEETDFLRAVQSRGLGVTVSMALSQVRPAPGGNPSPP